MIPYSLFCLQYSLLHTPHRFLGSDRTTFHSLRWTKYTQVRNYFQIISRRVMTLASFCFWSEITEILWHGRNQIPAACVKSSRRPPSFALLTLGPDGLTDLSTVSTWKKALCMGRRSRASEKAGEQRTRKQGTWLSDDSSQKPVACATCPL